MTDHKHESIMVVDDQPASLKLLEDMLRQQGYRVRSFPCGRLALAAARQDPPDLILLDIKMPEMNGYQVCEQLKADPALKAVPVIFLSALSETGDKVKAFECGAVDYITKPFQFEEVRARVETQSQLHQLQRALREHNDRLEELVGRRSRELAEAHGRLKILDRAKTDFLELLSHEFRTPLNGLLGVGELLLEGSGSDAELRDLFEQSRRRILTILEDALLLGQIEAVDEKFASERVPLDTALIRAISHAAGLARPRAVTLRPGPIPLASIHGRERLVVKALQSLLETAVMFAHAGEHVTVDCRLAAESVELSIESRGATIPPPLLPKFFDLLSIGEAITPGGDLGLSPAVAHRVLALCGDSVTVANHDRGIRFSVSLKRQAEPGLTADRRPL